ncbi:MAG: tRNA pseudouridine(38-40) synthase TruA [Flavobacteriales bacterium]
MRYFIHLSYCGTKYHGWQRQLNGITVQEQLEHCISTLLRKEIEVVGCGRTDTGVHAKDYYAHMEVEEFPYTEEDFTHKLNRFLPPDIAVFRVFKVADTLHARFDAKFREYEYHITFKKDPFAIERAYQYVFPLDLEKMKEAAALLPGFENFECFSKVNTDVAHFLCDVHHAFFEETSNGMIFRIRADRFLRNMVRAIVGTLIDVGKGAVSIEDFKKIVESRDRGKAGISVPAHALYLSKVEYNF